MQGQGQGPSLQEPGQGQGLDLQVQGQGQGLKFGGVLKDKDKDFTYSYLPVLQVAAKPTIAIKQQQRFHCILFAALWRNKS